MSTSRSLFGAVAAGLALVIGAAGAWAQPTPEVSLEYTPSFDPEQFAASADPDSIGMTDGARTAARGAYMAGLVFHVGGPPLDICVRDAGSTAPGCQVGGDLIGTRLRADLTALYGFGKFDLRFALPLVLHQSSDFAPAMGQEALRSAGVGDPRIGGRYQLWRGGDLALAGDLSFTIPTGGENFIGDAGWIADPRLLFDWRHGKLAAGASFGYRYRQDPARIANLYVDDELTWSAAGEYQLTPGRWTAGLALYGRLGLMTPAADPMAMIDIATDLGSEEFPIEALASSRYFVTDKVALDVGVGTALTAGYGAAPFRVLAGVQWVNRVKPPLFVDTDRDGIHDEDDRCPREPEDVDGFEDTDGCPEADNDGDGVADADDGCPLEAEDKDGFDDVDGCPEADNDKDGLADADDKCPDQAEDVDGFQDDDGCPDNDNDGDGVPDASDQCPAELEDVDGFQDDDGCPDVDNDGDGLLDGNDKCPNEAETVNGNADEDGCPDDRPIAVVSGSAIVINQRVFFDLNRARIKSRSFPILDAVVEVLNANDTLRVRVEGHTDDQGDATWNEELSQKRSEAVRKYLIKKGIDGARLEAKGYGFSRPMVDGHDEQARSQNRRVEFVIISESGGGAPPEPTAPATP